MGSKHNKNTAGVPMSRKMLVAMGILIVIEIMILVSTLFIANVFNQLNQNQIDILHERVINRSNYIENEMIRNWMNVDRTVQVINNTASEMNISGEISIDVIDDSSDNAAPLISSVSHELLSMLRSTRATGVFVIFNTDDLSDAFNSDRIDNKPGIYFRDLDPASAAPINNSDILIIRGPVSVVQNMGIPMNSTWNTMFEFAVRADDKSNIKYFYNPFQYAYENTNPKIEYHDFGYWSSPHILKDDNRQIVTYTVPLILDDGTVYGVLGVEVLTEYLKKLIPYEELNDKMGSYALAIEAADDNIFKNVLINGPVYLQAIKDNNTVVTNENEIIIGDDTFICSVEYIDIYNSNTAFSNEKWALLGIIRSQDLFAFSNTISTTLIFAIMLTLVVAAFGSYLISHYIARPMKLLTVELDNSHHNNDLHLTRTGFREIDRLVSSIESLSADILESSTKLSKILDMASVRIAGVEINYTENSIFLTDIFFEIFNIYDIDVKAVTIEDFERIIDDLQKYKQDTDTTEFELYKIPVSRNHSFFVKYQYINQDSKLIGLVEDVTNTILERERIEHERDHDALTNLLNRRAFHRVMEKLFSNEADKLKNAALLMMDLDNLKNINDTYGHEYGDKFIKTAAECFLDGVPENSIVSRISGDEFYIFIYGFDTKDEINDILRDLRMKIKSTFIILPNDELFHISASGGVAWYPDDSRLYDELLKFSDFAMYKTKQSVKGDMKNFDIEVYYHEQYLLQNKSELVRLIDNSLVTFHFQPIVDARTGELFAYEALMRSLVDSLRSPYEILTIARHESRLHDIEHLSLFKSTEEYVFYVKNNMIDPKIKLFINTIANQFLPPVDIQLFEEKFADCLSNLVIEITEEEESDEFMLNYKKEITQRWNAGLAMDDYGSGYNSEKTLLHLSPQFIKIDLEIIRDIDTNKDKQKIVQNVVSYGHERNMKIIAEGIETIEELEQVCSMDIDYLQGYLISKPQKPPSEISNEVKNLIINSYNKKRIL